MMTSWEQVQCVVCMAKMIKKKQELEKKSCLVKNLKGHKCKIKVL